jgi:hypothetical protein
MRTAAVMPAAVKIIRLPGPIRVAGTRGFMIVGLRVRLSGM